MPSNTKPDAPQTTEMELGQIIDALNLEALPKHYLKSRWLDQLVWMEEASKKNQRYYYIFRLSCIVGSVIIPALVSWNAGGKMGTFVQVVVVLLSLVVAVSAAVEEFFHFGERWRHYRRMAEHLKGDGWSFIQLSGNFHKFTSHADAYSEFTGRVEETLQREVSVFITKVSRVKTDGKNNSRES